MNGLCKQNLCTPGENACNGNQLQVCNSEGTSFELFDCSPGVCQDGTCIGCEVGTKECLEGNVVECVAGPDGDAIFEEVEICDTQAQCYQGSCLECFPGQGKCEGQDAYQCAQDGKSWEFAKKCSAGESCIGGVCQGLCTGDIKFNTNVGCDYWAVDLDNVDGDAFSDGAANAQFAIVVSNPSDVAADITVRSKDDGEPAAQAVVEPGGLKIFDLAPYNVDGTVKPIERGASRQRPPSSRINSTRSKMNWCTPMTHLYCSRPNPGHRIFGDVSPTTRGLWTFLFHRCGGV